MRHLNQNQLAAVTATIFLGVVEALAQDQQTLSSEGGEESRRRIVISIADKKLALVEDGHIARIYSVAVGADATPSPTGSFKIATRIKNPTWYGPKGKIVQPGKSN